MKSKRDSPFPNKKINLRTYEITVGDVMKKDVIVVGPECKMHAVREMHEKKKDAEVVITHKNKIIGVIEKESIGTRFDATSDACTVTEKMMDCTETVYSDTYLAQVVDKFTHCGIFFPVIDRREKRVVGTLARCNIVLGLYKVLQLNSEDEEIINDATQSLFTRLIADEKYFHLKYAVEKHNFDNAGEASNRFKKTLKHIGMSRETIQRASIIAYEAEMNLVVHSIGGTMTCTVSPDKIFLKAEDKGPGIENVEKVMKAGYSTAPDWVRELGFGAGMGLNNIQNYSDRMKLYSTVGEGTKLHSEIWINVCD